MTALADWEQRLLSERGVERLPDESWLGGYLEGAGLQAIQTRRLALPIDGEGDLTALYAKVAYFDCLRILGPQLVAANVVSRRLFEETLTQAHGEAGQMRCEWPVAIAYGRRDPSSTP